MAPRFLSTCCEYAARAGNLEDLTSEVLDNAQRFNSIRTLDNHDPLCDIGCELPLGSCKPLPRCRNGRERKNKKGKTALNLAKEKGHSEIVDLLLAGGATMSVPGPPRENLKRRGMFNAPSFLKSAKARDSETVRLFLGAGMKVETRGPGGRTALMRTSSNGHTDTAKLLIERGADPNAQDDSGHTAILGPASSGKTETVKLLIEKGADENVNHPYGTPLMRATNHRSVELVRLLLENGADVNTKNCETALGIARRRRIVREVVDFLIESGAKVDRADRRSSISIANASSRSMRFVVFAVADG